MMNHTFNFSAKCGASTGGLPVAESADKRMCLSACDVICPYCPVSTVGNIVDRLPSEIPGGELQRFDTRRALSYDPVTPSMAKAFAFYVPLIGRSVSRGLRRRSLE